MMRGTTKSKKIRKAVGVESYNVKKRKGEIVETKKACSKKQTKKKGPTETKLESSINKNRGREGGGEKSCWVNHGGGPGLAKRGSGGNRGQVVGGPKPNVFQQGMIRLRRQKNWGVWFTAAHEGGKESWGPRGYRPAKKDEKLAWYDGVLGKGKKFTKAKL